MRSKATDMRGKADMPVMRLMQYLCRHYVDTQQVRIGLEHRMRFARDSHVIQQLKNALDFSEERLEDIGFIETVKRTKKHTVTDKGLRAFRILKEKGKIPEDDEFENLMEVLEGHHDSIQGEEDNIEKEAKKILEGTAVFDWVENVVKGMSTVSAMQFLGYVDIRVPTAGKAKAYLGLIPDAKLESGATTDVNWEGKGKVLLFARNVIMHTDAYYYQLYKAKKTYLKKHSNYADVYVKTGEDSDGPLKPDNPEACPRYEECLKKREKRAKRLGTEVTPPACNKHMDRMAKRWLAEVILSHMWEICRRERGWNVSKHKMHIPPKPEAPEEVKDILKVAVPCITLGIVPESDLSREEDREELKTALRISE